MRYQQFASHAYCGASFQDGVAAGKGSLCAPFWGVQKHEKLTADSAWETWTVSTAYEERCARVTWDINEVCRIFSSWLFPGVCSLNVNVSEHPVCSIFIGEWVWSVTAVKKVGYSTWIGLARKIAWAPRNGVVGVAAGRENRRQLPPQSVLSTWSHPNYNRPRPGPTRD
jgi:hypothetical protein